MCINLKIKNILYLLFIFISYSIACVFSFGRVVLVKFTLTSKLTIIIERDIIYLCVNDFCTFAFISGLKTYYLVVILNSNYSFVLIMGVKNSLN